MRSRRSAAVATATLPSGDPALGLETRAWWIHVSGRSEAPGAVGSEGLSLVRRRQAPAVSGLLTVCDRERELLRAARARGALVRGVSAVHDLPPVGVGVRRAH